MGQNLIVGILGYGIVGQAVAAAFSEHEVKIHDPAMADGSPFGDLAVCDCVFVCVPSPQGDHGACDSSVLVSTVNALAPWASRGQVVISKTTAPPSVYDNLHQQHPWLVYSPEFLTATNHIRDFQQQTKVILGGDRGPCESASECLLMASGPQQFLFCDIKTASFFKYLVNAFLATKVTFMNDFYRLAHTLNLDWEDIIDLGKIDPRLGTSHWQVPGPDGEFGWAGSCFPKDVCAIIHESQQSNCSLTLLEQVYHLNQTHRRLA